MKRIKNDELPEPFRSWYFLATDGKRKSSYLIYGFNSRFALIKVLTDKLDGYGTRDKKYFQWIVVEWAQQKNLNTFLFKKPGGLVKADKAKILKDFGIDLKPLKI